MRLRRILCIMSQILPRRSFLAALSALSALWAGSQGSKPVLDEDPYIPSFLHPNDRWVVLRGDKDDLYEIMDLETGRRVMTLSSSSCDTWYGQPELQFDPSGRFLVMGYSGYHSASLRRWDLSGKLDVLGFSPKDGADDASYRMGAEGGTNIELSRHDESIFMLPEPGGILRTPMHDWRLSDFRLIRRRASRLSIPPLSGKRLAVAKTRRGAPWEVVAPPIDGFFRRVRASSKAAQEVPVAGRAMHWPPGENLQDPDICLARRRSTDNLLIWTGYSTLREIDSATGALVRCVSGSMPQTGLLAFGASRASVYAARPLDTAFHWNRNGVPAKGRGRIEPGDILMPPGSIYGPPQANAIEEGSSMGVRALARGVPGLALGLDNGDVWHGLGKNKAGGPWLKVGQHDDVIRALAFVPERPWLISGARDGSLAIWNIEAKSLLKQLPPHDSRVNGASVFAAECAATCGPDGIRLWDLEGGSLRRHLETGGVWVSDVAVSPDGGRVAGALLDGTVRMWDVEGGQLIWSAQAGAGWCAALAFHPDGIRLNAGYELGQILEWNVASGARLRKVRVTGKTPWQEGPRPVHALTWSADGQALAAAFGDAVRVYDRNLHSAEGPGWILPLDWADEYT